VAAGGQLLIALNYHRVDQVDRDNPFHWLHTVPLCELKLQLELLAEVGNFVPLGRCPDEGGPGRPWVVISFDDLPFGAAPGIELAQLTGVPFAASVCSSLTEYGNGNRDRVRAVVGAIGNDEIYSLLRRTHAECLPSRDKFSFYDFSRSDVLDPRQMETEVIEPLYEVARQRDPRAQLVEGRGYMDWGEVRTLAEDPLVTIVNHGHSHLNYAALSSQDVREDIRLGHDWIAAELGQECTHFATPFGNPRQRVCLDVSAAAHELGYRTVLWVDDAANLLPPVPEFREQPLRHVIRLHAPKSADGLRQSLAALQHPERRRRWLVESIPASKHRIPVSIQPIKDLEDIRAFELIAREEKAHAVDPDFFAYQFDENPSQQTNPIGYAAFREGRAEAALYGFRVPFRIGGTVANGLYLASWRRLPEANALAGGLLLRALTAEEAVVGVQAPSDEAGRAFADWLPVEVRSVSLDPGSVPRRRGAEVEVTTEIPDDLAPLCEATMRRVSFGVERSLSFYRWRLGRYPLLPPCRVMILRDSGRPRAAAFVLDAGSNWSVCDHLSDGPDSVYVVRLVEAVAAMARQEGVSTIEMKTADPELAEGIAGLGRAKTTARRSWYRLDAGLLGAIGVDVARVLGQWPAGLHETEISGDVLPRRAVYA
jgi:polysaccharide deacetylase